MGYLRPAHELDPGREHLVGRHAELRREVEREVVRLLLDGVETNASLAELLEHRALAAVESFGALRDHGQGILEGRGLIERGWSRLARPAPDERDSHPIP